MSRKLCGMLVWYKESYRPPQTMLIGIAGMSFQRIPGVDHLNFEFMVSVQMEQMAGVLALANISQQAGAISVSNIIFALLEGDVMYLETLAFRTDCQFYHLLVQQLLRLMAREVLGFGAITGTNTNKLGRMARSILFDGILGGEASFPTSTMSTTTARHILGHAAEVLSSPKKVTNDAILQLLQGPAELNCTIDNESLLVLESISAFAPLVYIYHDSVGWYTTHYIMCTEQYTKCILF